MHVCGYVYICKTRTYDELFFFRLIIQKCIENQNGSRRNLIKAMINQSLIVFKSFVFSNEYMYTKYLVHCSSSWFEWNFFLYLHLHICLLEFLVRTVMITNGILHKCLKNYVVITDVRNLLYLILSFIILLPKTANILLKDVVYS